MKRLLSKTAANLRHINLISSSNDFLNARAKLPVSSAAHCSRSAFQRVCYYSSDSNQPPAENGSPALGHTSSEDKLAAYAAQAKDVPTKELNKMLDNYFDKEDLDGLPNILEAIASRKSLKSHEKSDGEIEDSIENDLSYKVDDEDVESDFEKLYETDEELENLYDTRTYVDKKMLDDEFYNMDDKKWDSMVNELIQSGQMRDTKECEELLEDMLNYNHLLPDDIKKSVEMKLDEIEGKFERGEIELEEARAMYQKFEDKIVKRTQLGPTDLGSNRAGEPAGEGPILRWQTRVVFAPGGDAWHPKNRKVKLFVTVGELGLSRNQFRRLRELVGKRYDCGRDELTITSERFEHREENRKDCLRTLFGLIEEAGKGDRLAEEARVAYVKERLRGNAAFMERLRARSCAVSL